MSTTTASATPGKNETPISFDQLERIGKEWRQAVDASPMVLFVVDSRFVITRVNRAATAFLRRPFSELIGARIEDAAGIILRAADPDFLGRARDSVERVEAEIFLEEPVLWVELAIDPILSDLQTWSGAVISVRDITTRKSAEAQLRFSRERLRDLFGELDHAVEKERARIARNMHDELGAELTILEIEINRLRERLEEDPAAALERMREAVGRASGTVHSIARGLRPPLLESLGIGAAIEEHARTFARRSGLAVQVDADDVALPEEAATALFRVAQEALTNVASHSGASVARVSLQSGETGIEMRIEDDGCGFEPDARVLTSLGLLGMLERLRRVGGDLTVRSSVGSGTTIIARLEPQERVQERH